MQITYALFVSILYEKYYINTGEKNQQQADWV